MKHMLIIAGLFLVALCAGCAHDRDAVRPAEELFQTATDLAAQGRVEKATDAFMEVRTYHPGHELARQALLSLGDLHYDNELYDEALRYYGEYRLLFPTDPGAPYSLFRIGMCHFQQRLSFDRDQSQTVKAIETFDTFLAAYPESPYAGEARERLTDARRLLAEHYLSIGRFYLRNKNPDAACRRFQQLQDQFSGLGLDIEIEQLIRKACPQ
ncbi:MAG: outer membrane protein assembly factor BamD [Desulfomonilia bacterium]|nr:outer membrane protein assembly factor BamD [Desulfomonilia bacterium]